MIQNRTPYPLSRVPRRALWLAPLAVLLLLVLLFFNKMAFTNLILARGDTFLYFYPYWQAATQALRAGRIPLWNPHLFMGGPFLANSQIGFFYPLNWPLWWFLSPPYAVGATILLHLFIAGWGAYLAGRRLLSLSRPAALLTAVLFALGGYLTAQVEHVNQLQGLAWLPWLLAVWGDGRWQRRDCSHVARTTSLVALLFTMQLLAGHTQTTFITGVAVIIWLFSRIVWFTLRPPRRTPRSLLHTPRATLRALRATLPAPPRRAARGAALPVFAGALLALILAAVQLLPTLELARLSVRGGGLPVNEVLSFSLHPLLLTRALLPTYNQPLFSEYIAFLPLTALLLSVVGGWQWRQRRGVLPVLVLTVMGLFLALGAFNPFYWLLARLPGFNLFRVPARWLVLYALGGALLAGVGWEVVLGEEGRDKWVLRPLRWGLSLLLLLMVWGALAVPLTRFIPTGPEAPAQWPSWLTWLGWTAELTIGFLLFSWQQKPALIRSVRLTPPRLVFSSFLLLTAFLFLASRSHPYNNLTTPQAYFGLRPPITRLQAAALCRPQPCSVTDVTADGQRNRLLSPSTAQSIPRFLSLSDIFFDPGDQAEIEAIYGQQLSADALYDYVVATKQKEIIAPNLPLAYGLASVDGFDGGILPLSSYSQLMQLILPQGVTTSDGRLREHLSAVPEARWLDLFNARYTITDKTGDVWRRGVFFDRQHPVTLAEGQTAAVGYVPDFEATELWLMASVDPGTVTVVTEAGETWRLMPEQLEADLYRMPWPEAAVAQSITLSSPPAPAASPLQILGLSLVDSRDGTFQPLVLGNYRLIHSGDVKIYENLDVLPRAFLVYDWQWQPDVAASVAAMEMLDFDPRQTAVLVGEGEAPAPVSQPSGQVEILSYEPERIVLRTDSERAGLLLLTDAYYPGWETAVDGRPALLYQADGLFRGVMVPAGRHEVVFSFAPSSLSVGWAISAIGVLFWLLFVLPWRRWLPGQR